MTLDQLHLTFYLDLESGEQFVGRLPFQALRLGRDTTSVKLTCSGKEIIDVQVLVRSLPPFAGRQLSLEVVIRNTLAMDHPGGT